MPITVGRRVDLSRIQRSLREIGRIRTGFSTPTTSARGKAFNKPERSETFILSSLQKPMIERAAALWGGTVEAWTPQGSKVPMWRVVTEAPVIDAILPPGNPFSSMYEMWSGGQCLRRCDGVTEDKTAKPCACITQFGEEWHLREPKVPPEVCKITGRLNVYLELGDDGRPETQDFGFWRLETHGFYPVSEMSGIVDYIKGRLGYEPSIRIRLAIEQRMLRRALNQVVAIRVRDELMLQILSGVAPALMLDGTPQSATALTGPRVFPEQKSIAATATVGSDETADAIPGNIPAAPPGQPASAVVDWPARFTRASDMEVLRQAWRDCYQAGALDDEVKAAWHAAAAKLRQPPPPAVAEDEEPPDEAADAEPPIDGEMEPDPLAVWTEILTLGGQRGWNAEQIKARLKPHDPETADGWALAIFRDAIKDGHIT